MSYTTTHADASRFAFAQAFRSPSGRPHAIVNMGGTDLHLTCARHARDAITELTRAAQALDVMEAEDTARLDAINGPLERCPECHGAAPGHSLLCTQRQVKAAR